ncbi:hypothetical protein [Amycolatopsis alkalitolerans]|uniref:Sensor domain-containing protein n=1 Tax=Amycolatopsis alkalitolerans TaxID=2547244 RepID=A0A5C4LWV4_9PSEU|nr:hypothetical protein [Amycolatopsis alkalitolerans]TNC23769.1 hypothetical protein FG385_20665 [Amycolatopsis alkalitolerans]
MRSTSPAQNHDPDDTDRERAQAATGEPEPELPATSRRWPSKFRRPFVLATTTLVIVSGVVAAMVLTMHGRSPSPTSAAAADRSTVEPPAAAGTSAPAASAAPTTCPTAPMAGSVTAGDGHLTLTADQVPYSTLVQSDLPEGWQVAPAPDSATGTAPASGYSPLDDLARTMSRAPVRTGVRFVKGNSGSLVQQAVAVPAKDGASAALTAFSSATRACTEFAIPGRGSSQRVTVRPLVTPARGDSSAAVQLVTPTSRGQVVVDVVVVRIGKALTTLYLAGVGDVPADLVDSVTAHALDRVRAAARA